MGFLDFLGETVGRLGAVAQEVNTLKSEYECMNNDQLKLEYMALKGKSGTENRNRFTAIKMILTDRGVIKNNTD